VGQGSEGELVEKIIVDSDVIIDYVWGIEKAAEFLDSLPSESRFTTVLNCIEVLQGAQNKIELKKLDKFLTNTFQLLNINPNSSEIALGLIRVHALADGLRAGDALIAAVAIENKATLATGNYRHFKNIRGLKLIHFKKT
jgi:predicted nucleic acid-binding protein